MNSFLEQRLRGLHQILLGAYEASGHFAAANKGSEREAFVTLFLSQVLPPIYRFGSGEITDGVSQPAKRSGQLDVVIEMPWAPSFALPAGAGVRLYPSEAVGAAIEVKSNIQNQWSEVCKTSDQLAPLRQKLAGTSVNGGSFRLHDETLEPIPLYAVGFKGWATFKSIDEHLRASQLDGILILNPLHFVESDRLTVFKKRRYFHEQMDERLQRGENVSDGLRACRRIADLHVAGVSSTEIASTLNIESLTSTAIHLGDHRNLPSVNAGAWTLTNVEDVVQNVGLHTQSYNGEEALLAFVARIHTEVSKRSSMSFELMDYGK